MVRLSRAFLLTFTPQLQVRRDILSVGIIINRLPVPGAQACRRRARAPRGSVILSYGIMTL